MKKIWLWLPTLLVIALSCSRLTATPLNSSASAKIYIDGELTDVFFNDGDTFRIQGGSRDKSSVRIAGFNALESYGPVHQWGTWTAKALKNIADEATHNARKGGWHCTMKGEQDVYGRLLGLCDDLAIDQIQRGLAFAMFMNKEEAQEHLIAAQKQAMQSKVGMWKYGVPAFIVSSVHSLGENANEQHTYNRFVSTSTGLSNVIAHTQQYQSCQNICYSAQAPDFTSAMIDSCMIYVPYESRYGPQRAPCLK